MYSKAPKNHNTMFANHIIANKRAEAIGSIGAYTTILDLKGFYEQIGVKIHEIYATKSTDKNAEYREVLEGNYEPYLKNELDPLVDQFIEDMRNSRSNISEEVFNGATYNGPEALEKGMVDSLGDLNDAINKVFELSNNKN